MEILFTSLAQYSGQVLLILCVFNIVVAFALIRLAKRQARTGLGLRDLVRDADGGNIEDLLQRHLHERGESQSQIDNLMSRALSLEKELAGSKRHLGLVRYDAFEDVSGSQSFAMALYDDSGNGAILNGVVGRNDARIYCKPLINGRSDRKLSQEEERAIREARDAGPKTIVSS